MPHLVLLVFLIITSRSGFGYTLADLSTIKSCPFNHEDSYGTNIGHLHNLVKHQLVTKIEGNQKCDAIFRGIANNLNQVNHMFASNNNPSLIEDIKADFLDGQLAQLETELLLAKNENTPYESILTDIKNKKSLIDQNRLDQQIHRATAKEYRKNEMLRSSFDYLNESLNSLANLDPECMTQLGGWQTVLPIALNMASSLSGSVGTPLASSIGSGLKVVSALTQILKDLKAKRALKEIINHKNSKILACTYYTIQDNACRYRRALNFGKEYKKIKDLILRRYSHKKTKIYDEYFYLKKHAGDFESIFFEISSMGSAITLDVDVMSKYFRAKRSDPASILSSGDIGPPPDESDDSPDADFRRQAWLIKIKARGITFLDRDLQGNLKTLKNQVVDALTDINNKIADIESVESLVTQIRSFIDLKHRLDKDPSNYAKVLRFKEYLNKIIEKKVIKTENIGLLMSALRVLESLSEFLSVKFNQYLDGAVEGSEREHGLTPYDVYYREVNKKGRILFERMSEGAVAQVDQQTVLTIGNIVQARINRVFTLLEEEFLRREVKKSSSSRSSKKEVKYSDYKRDQAILVDIAESYGSVVGGGKTFRLEDVSVAIKSLEEGFKSEIRKMVVKSMKEKSDFFPDLEGTTASHLCVLFAHAFQRKGIGNLRSHEVLKKCKRQFSSLELYPFFSKSSLEIDWEDPCFYFDYNNILETQKNLYENMVDYGFSKDFF